MIERLRRIAPRRLKVLINRVRHRSAEPLPGIAYRARSSGLFPSNEEDVAAVEAASREFVARLIEIASPRFPRGGNPFPKAVQDVLSSDLAVNPFDVLSRANSLRLDASDSPICVDFGCGAGVHRKLIERLGLEYLGLDYMESNDPARLDRQGTDFDTEVIEYDGLTIPMADASASVVWAWSSLEHCIDTDRSFAEIARITVPGGVLAGSVPHVLPYHAESTVNFTPYGFVRTCRRHGFTPIQLVPHMDGISFLVKNTSIALGLFDDPIPIDQAFRRKPLLDPVFDLFRSLGYANELILQLQAELCGEFAFIARRDAV